MPWAPQPKRQELLEFADREGLVIEIREPEPTDEPPTLLNNPLPHPCVLPLVDLSSRYQ